MNSYKKVIESFPNTPVTPHVVLARTLEKIDRIKSITIVIEWDDETFDVDFSTQSKAGFRMAGYAIDKVIHEEMSK